MRTIGSLAIVAATFTLAACDSGTTSPPKPDPAATGAKTGAATTGSATKPAAVAKAKGPFPASTHEAMKDPAKATEEAPAEFTVKFDTTAGEFSMDCTRDWAPYGADRFYNLVKIGYFDDVSFFRAVKGFVVQFGIHGDPEVNKAWREANITPDEVKESNKKGTLTFAQAGRPKEKGKTAESRSTQLFINLKDNDRLDGMGFAPLCTVTEGMDVVMKLHTGYGERAGRDQGPITMKGNEYLRKKYPLLDYIKTARLSEGGDEGKGGGDAGEGGGAGEQDADQKDEATETKKSDAPAKDAPKGEAPAPTAKEKAAAPPAPKKAAPAPAPAPAME
ncbi:MAG: peptidylprolyl isomerase [Polyangiaceae bacterium]